MRPFSTVFIALAVAMSGAAATAQEKPLEIDIRSPLDLSEKDDSRWRVIVDTMYMNQHGKVTTRPAFTLEADSGSCVKGKTRLLQMRGGFEAEVAEQFCVNLKEGKTYLNVWSTADYPDDISDKIPGDKRGEFVYGTHTELLMDSSSGFAQTKNLVFNLTFERVRPPKTR
ncbi:TPA: hypothetical protein ACUUEN_005477 [Pseudomonas aeruginosa]